MLEGQVQLQGWVAPRFPSCLNTLGKDKMGGVWPSEDEGGRDEGGRKESWTSCRTPWQCRTWDAVLTFGLMDTVTTKTMSPMDRKAFVEGE